VIPRRGISKQDQSKGLSHAGAVIDKTIKTLKLSHAGAKLDKTRKTVKLYEPRAKTRPEGGWRRWS